MLQVTQVTIPMGTDKMSTINENRNAKLLEALMEIYVLCENCDSVISTATINTIITKAVLPNQQLIILNPKA